VTASIPAQSQLLSRLAADVGGGSEGRIRVELADRHGTVAQIFDPDELRQHLKPRQRDQLAALADRLVRDLAQALGRGEDDARQVAVALLIRLQADEAAYERVAGRRGLLPL
jgi:hypothetical protein